ncbi:MAG: sensor histidine kinase [Crocinitomicaceae bacterium]|nr:sensor histidine kinase [Crocinitomicaceae bacterium]
MNLIKVPPTSYDNYFDQSKFNLTWKINVFIFFTNLVILPFMFFLALDEFFGILFSTLLALTYQVVLYRTRKYKTIAVIWVSVGVLSTAGSLLFIPTLMHLSDLIFMFTVIVYAFFTLGRTAGIVVSIGNLVAITIYLVFVLNTDKLFFEQISAVEITKTVLISVYGLTITAFIFSKFLELNKYAASQYVEANQQLEEINEVVNKRNEEKTVMLREIHHRVKNNLQVITSLLRLQASEETDERTLTKFDEATRRIAAMSLIHEKIYQSEDLARLDFNDYLHSLGHDLIDSYALTTDVDIEVKSDPIDLSNKYFVPIALLCNELISNSLKHAFTDSRRGRINVELVRYGEGKYRMTYMDTGKWKPPAEEVTFGMELIHSLIEQLNGSFSRSELDTGTWYQFEMTQLND